MPPLVTDHLPALLSASYSSDRECVCKVKCVLVGDGAIGKTSLIVSYTTNGYPMEYVPTAFDNYSVIVNVNNQPVRLQICDTAGQDDFDSLRPLCYPQTDVFLLCFSVVSPTSFHNIAEKWVPEIRRHCPRSPALLVGTQCDLRSDVSVLIELANYNEHPVTEQEAHHFASHIGAVGYKECSALTQKNLKEVFDTAILAAVRFRKPDLISSDESKARAKSSSGSHSHSRHDEVRGRPWCDERKKRGWKRFCCFS